MADIYMISCTSGALPYAKNLLGTGSVPACNLIGGVADPMIFTPYPFPPFDSSQIQPEIVVALISGGFLLYLIPWASAFGFTSLIKLLR